MSRQLTNRWLYTFSYGDKATLADGLYSAKSGRRDGATGHCRSGRPGPAPTLIDRVEAGCGRNLYIGGVWQTPHRTGPFWGPMKQPGDYAARSCATMDLPRNALTSGKGCGRW